MGAYDKSSKWLIEHHGDSILRLAGATNIVSWRPLPPEQVQLGQLPDGLLEVQFAADSEPTLVLLELATFPERRVFEQIQRDIAMVYLARRILPEALVVVFHPKGQFRVQAAQQLESPQGWTRWDTSWRVVELWSLSAEALLASGDLGLVPWAPLAATTATAEQMLQSCRDSIERYSDVQGKEMLLAVTQVFASLRYKDERLLALLGGKKTMLEFPIIQELLAERSHMHILRLLRGRFGEVPQTVVERLNEINKEETLDALNEYAGLCPDLNSFCLKLEHEQ